MIRKRLLLELKYFFSLKLSNHFFLELCQEDLLNENTKFILSKKKNLDREILFLIDIPKNYPFKAPNLYLKNSNTYQNNLNSLNNLNTSYNKINFSYRKWIYNTSEDVKKYINNFNISSYEILLSWFFVINKNIRLLEKKPLFFTDLNKYCLCCTSIINNWSPQNKLADLIIEYLLLNDFFSLSSKLGFKYINPIFNNEKWNLSEDIIELILHKLLN